MKNVIGLEGLQKLGPTILTFEMKMIFVCKLLSKLSHMRTIYTIQQIFRKLLEAAIEE